ncbi:hypothetical protein Tco_0329023 [Tanacetum coccineum]
MVRIPFVVKHDIDPSLGGSNHTGKYSFDGLHNLQNARGILAYGGSYLPIVFKTNKATLKREHWIRDPETGAYDLDRIRRGKPDEYTDDEWEKYINFWNDPANVQRAETNRLNRSKSTVVSRHGSRSIPLTRHLMDLINDDVGVEKVYSSEEEDYLGNLEEGALDQRPQDGAMSLDGSGGASRWYTDDEWGEIHQLLEMTLPTPSEPKQIG